MLARRRAWFAEQPDLDPEKLVFIDETGASTKMARLYGRATRGDGPPARVSYLAQGGQLNFAKALMSLDEGERPITIDRR